jgi:alpha-mannosidase
LSLLRSPTVPDYLHEPLYYSAYNWEGQRDTGHHSFDYAVCAYDDSFAHTSIEADAMGFNARLIATLGEVSLGELPEINSQNTYISSIKLAEKSDALIVRIAEFRGKKGEVMITLPNWAESVDVVNMLERDNKPLIAENGVARLSVRAFEIVTLSFKKR